MTGEMTEEEMLQVTRELASAPAEDVIANHCYGMFELAALHLSGRPPNLDKARLAIDAMGFLIDGLGSRLGSHGAALGDGLNQLRLAFVRISEAGSASNGQPSSAAAPGGGGGGSAPAES